jgi:hypothetical protein
MVDELATPVGALRAINIYHHRREGEARMARSSTKPRSPVGPLAASDAEALAQHREMLAAMRALAMTVIAGLNRIAAGQAEPKDAALLGKSRTLVDGVATMSLVVTRLVDCERRLTIFAAAAKAGQPTKGQQEIERRIFAELDRFANARGAAELHQRAQPDGGQGAVEAVAASRPP